MGQTDRQTDRPTDQPTNRQTDKVTCRVACTRLKNACKKKPNNNKTKREIIGSELDWILTLNPLFLLFFLAIFFHDSSPSFSTMNWSFMSIFSDVVSNLNLTGTTARLWFSNGPIRKIRSNWILPRWQTTRSTKWTHWTVPKHTPPVN